VDDLERFLGELRNISEHQNALVGDLSARQEDLDSDLLSVRHEMSRLRTSTFKQIYDLHKQVQIAESLELGTRRLSVASATEVDQERRHHSVKIQRQLTTLAQCVADLDSSRVSQQRWQLREMVDIERIMGHCKVKGFFCVFVQTMSQTLIDIEITHNQLNSDLPPRDGGRSNALCSELYGIERVVAQCGGGTHSLHDKLVKCERFLRRIKHGIVRELSERESVGVGVDGEVSQSAESAVVSEAKVSLLRVSKVMLIVARKLCVDERVREHIMGKEEGEVSEYAEERMRELFDAVLSGREVFEVEPMSQMDAARQILKRVYKVDVDEVVF